MLARLRFIFAALLDEVTKHRGGASEGALHVKLIERTHARGRGRGNKVGVVGSHVALALLGDSVTGGSCFF